MASAVLPLGALLSRAHARYVAECEERLMQAGFDDLTVAHGANVLRHLVPGEPTRTAEVVRRASVTKQAVSQQISYLAAHGYLTVSPDHADRRAKTVTLTERGERSQHAFQAIFAAVRQEWDLRHGTARMDEFLTLLGEISEEGASNTDARSART